MVVARDREMADNCCSDAGISKDTRFEIGGGGVLRLGLVILYKHVVSREKG